MLVLGLGLAGSLFSDATTTEFLFISNPESKQANTLLEQRLRGPNPLMEVVVVRSADLTVDDPAYQKYVEGLHNEIVGLGSDAVARATNYYQTGDKSLVSDDRRSTILPIVLTCPLTNAEANVEAIHEILDHASAPSDVEVFITGEATLSRDFTEGNQDDAKKGEAIAMPIALIILAVVFGALAAALLPLVLAVCSIVIAVGLAALIGQGFALHVFVQNMITMIGLAVGIDYSLFIVSRYREERGRGLAKLEAIAEAGATAGRTVLFSGLTVVLALIGLLIVPHVIYISMGIGAILVVTVAIMASLTLLPATLSVMGDRVNKFRIPLLNSGTPQSVDRRGGFWDRVTYAVMRRPVISVVLTTGLLMAAAVPYIDIKTGWSGVSTFPDKFRAKQGFVVLQSEFGFGLNNPAEVVIDSRIDSTQVLEAIQGLQATLDSDPTFGPSALQINQPRDLALLSVPLVGDSTSDQNVASVRRLRDEYIPQSFLGVPATVLVTGDTAFQVDQIDQARNYLPIMVAVVLGLSFMLLTVVFRSIVIPVKSIIMNLLSVGAAYGLLVLVFQKGVGNEFFGFPQVDVIQWWLPLMLFAVLFGLSMDYQVFLISRIRERYLQTGNNEESVAFGLRSTAGLITGAALIMVAVFSGFAAGELVALSQFGFGMAVAILLDSTIVRSILVPATMKLLGDWNWYLPNWLRWLPDLRVEVTEPPEAIASGD